MEDSIILDKEKGINPKIALCPNCGEESNALLLLGNKGYTAYCSSCSKSIIGVTEHHRTCPICRCSPLMDLKKIEGSKVISDILCDTCEMEKKEHEDIVKAGGIFWKCSKCNSSGVIKKNSFTDFIRKKLNTLLPNPAGVDFEGKEQCPVCNKV